MNLFCNSESPARIPIEIDETNVDARSSRRLKKRIIVRIIRHLAEIGRRQPELQQSLRLAVERDGEDRELSARGAIARQGLVAIARKHERFIIKVAQAIRHSYSPECFCQMMDCPGKASGPLAPAEPL